MITTTTTNNNNNNNNNNNKNKNKNKKKNNNNNNTSIIISLTLRQESALAWLAGTAAGLRALGFSKNGSPMESPKNGCFFGGKILSKWMI